MTRLTGPTAALLVAMLLTPPAITAAEPVTPPPIIGTAATGTGRRPHAEGAITTAPPVAQAGPVILLPRDPLHTLRDGHPRVLISAAEVQRLGRELPGNPELGRWLAVLQAEAEALISSPTDGKDNPLPPYDLVRSAQLQHHALLLGLLYRLGKDQRYAQCLWPGLAAAIQAPDWRPGHFLTTAEVTSALGVAYDWLYEAWTPDQRALLRKAIIDKGLKPGLAAYQGNADPAYPALGGWPRARHNWNQVCNGGLLMGALAIADEERETAGAVVLAALRSLPLALAAYAPDGAWAEGPRYWAFATEYAVYGLATLQASLGTDFGLSSLADLSLVGDFAQHIHGPAGLCFNFADARLEKRCGFSPLFWMADRSSSPWLAARQRPLAAMKPRPLDLLWGAPWVVQPPADRTAPLSRHFRTCEIVTMRSAWQNAQAMFVGCLGGDHQANHSHLDFGSFVFDALGTRWAHDLGPDSYQLPQYFRERRWSYYRLRAEGHNTFVLNPDAAPDQDPLATARIVTFSDATPAPFAIIDLSAAYRRHARMAQRGFRLERGQALIIQDELRCEKPVEYWWFMHTAASIACDGAIARLSSGDRLLTARILAPADARFQDLPAQPLPSSPDPPGQAHAAQDDAGAPIRKLAIHLTGLHGDVRVVVQLAPGMEGPAPPRPSVIPLQDWH